MNSFNVTNTNAKDVKARNLIAKFYVGDGYSKGIPARKCTQITECYGDNPSHADVVAPLKELVKAGQWDQRDPVALNAGGPAGSIKIFSRASCGLLDNGYYVPLINGWVLDIGHHMRADCVTWKIYDDRHIMTRYLCFGRMVYEPGAGLFFNSNPNDGLIFNRDGHGDMLKVNGQRRFAVGRRYGSIDSEAGTGYAYPTSGGTENESRSGSWRASDIIEYLRDFFTNTNRPNLGQDYGEMALPSSLKWPRNLGAALGDDDRTPQHMDLQGMDLLSALRRVVQYCGPYDIHVAPVNEKESELKIINFNPSDKTGSYMYTARYLGATLEECINNPSIIWDGVITESGRKTFAGGVVLMGNSPETELMASTDTSGSNDGLGALGYLENGWTEAEQTSALSWLNTLNVGLPATNPSHPDEVPSAENWNHMADRYPNVFAWYKINEKSNPFSLTKWANLPHGGTPRIKTNILTAFNETATNPIGMVTREIKVEHKLSDEEYAALSTEQQARGHWRVAGTFPGLQISPCGRYIAVPGLRDNESSVGYSGTTYQTDTSPGGVEGDPDEVGSRYHSEHERPRKIRFMLAVEHNQCLVARAGKSDEDQTGTMHRVDKEAPKWACQILSNPLSYLDQTRTSKSYPCGIGGITGDMRTGLLNRFPAKATEGNELFSDLARMRNHANIHVKNFKRVDYQGVMEFAQLAVAWRVGMQITVEAQNVIGKVSGVVRAVSWSDSTNHTQVEFGPNDLAAIYDGPIAISGSIAGGNASGGGGGGNGTSTQESGYEDTGKSSGGDTSYDNGGESPAYGGAASSNDAISSDNDSSANNSAIQNNPTAGGGISGNVGAINMASRGRAASGIKNLFGGGESVAEQKKGTIKTGDQLAGRDYNAGEGNEAFDSGRLDPSTGREKAVGKGIYFGDSMRGLDEDRKQRTFEPGGIRDLFREGRGGPAGASINGKGITPTAGPVSREGRQKELFNAEVARGFNPTGAASIGQSSRAAKNAKAVKPYESSADWNKRKSKKL